MMSRLARYVNVRSIKGRVIIGVLAIFFISMTVTNIWWRGRLIALGETEIVDKARSICIMGESVREYQADNWGRGVFDRERLMKDVKGKFVYAVPVFSSIMTMRKKAAELGFIFRVPKFYPRNPENTPTAQEADVLKTMTDENKTEHLQIDFFGEKTIKYYRAVRLTRDCLVCHGDPKTSKELWGRDDGKDPTGGTMEGWKEGEIHGAFEIAYSVDKFISEQFFAIVLSIILNIVIFVVALVLIRLIVKRSLSPLDGMAVAFTGINEGAGDLTVKLDIQREDEVGRLAGLFNGFVDKLREIISLVHSSADQVRVSSQEMTRSSSDLAHVAQDQAASIEETSSALEEIKATIDAVSDNAKQQAKKADLTKTSMEYLAGAIVEINRNAQDANRMADETHGYAMEGEKILVNTVDSMKDINESSRKITEIVTIISEISDKINLLSLNASIEAARAGEHGRGFAVVAEEISKLADQTAASSKEINTLIAETSGKVDAGSSLVERTAASLREIIGNVKKTAGLMESIAKSSVDLTSMSVGVKDDVLSVSRMSEEISVMMEEQSLSSNEIIKAIDQINRITQHVASGSEELAATSEELTSQSEILNDIVRQFKLE
ncbi:MAG: methyl-accepting chemotaxis protein [Spirochaetes bacterium]|nr:MAG: methyl-accepting chemotaxis protein [Spirochaetota bacterium]